MLQCPKCHATMRTYNRNGAHIEQCEGCRGIFLDYGELEALSRLESQCEGCRGIFLDYGELEALSRLESQWAPPPPPAHGAPGGAAGVGRAAPLSTPASVAAWSDRSTLPASRVVIRHLAEGSSRAARTPRAGRARRRL